MFNSTFNGSNIGSDSKFSVQIDGDFMRASGTTQLRKGQFVKVPYLLGANVDEGASFGTEGINTTAEFVASILDTTPGLDDATIDILLALYPDIPEIGIPATLQGRPSYASGYGYQWKREAAYAGDLKMHAARRLAAQSWAQYNVSAYAYHFNVLVNGAEAVEGAGHFREVAFVFDDTSGLGYNNSVAVDPFADEPETFGQLVEMMSRMWVSFITDLDPNHSGGTLNHPTFPPNWTLCVLGVSLLTFCLVYLRTVTDVEWPKYSLDNPENLVFDVNVTGLAYSEPDIYRAEAINFLIENLDSVFNQ